jgi:hypothetical protein
MLTSIRVSRHGLLGAVLSLVLVIGTAAPADAGAIFLTGHDPDFHAVEGPNIVGAQNINTAAIDFILDPLFNPFVATAPKFLFVESKGNIPGGHVQGKTGIVASGFAEGTDFDHHDFSTLDAALDLLGTAGGYSGIVVASDFGGILRQAELDILNDRKVDIINFLNAGGGLYAMSEGNGGANLTPGGGHFGFLPFVATAVNFDQTEVGYTVTPFGTSLGLTANDVNGNFSHIVFTSSGPLQVVDRNAAGSVLSIAGRAQVSVPEPAMVLLFGLGLLFIARLRSRRSNTSSTR